MATALVKTMPPLPAPPVVGCQFRIAALHTLLGWIWRSQAEDVATAWHRHTLLWLDMAEPSRGYNPVYACAPSKRRGKADKGGEARLANSEAR